MPRTVKEIGGEKIVILKRAAVSTTKPEFTSITLAPGRGMEIIQITANFPGKGEVNVLASPDLEGAKKMLDEQDDAFGNLGYRLGAAFLRSLSEPHSRQAIRGRQDVDHVVGGPHDYLASQQYRQAAHRRTARHARADSEGEDR